MKKHNCKKQEMKSLLTQIKHAKITTREVLIHLRKSGELKRKTYLKYLKMQYRLTGETYARLQSNENNCTNNPENLYNTPNEKKLTMPVHLVKSELSAMSKSFEDTSFLTEAWHFFQKEMMNNSCKSPDFHPVPEFVKISELSTINYSNHSDDNNTDETLLFTTNNNAIQTKPQSQATLIPSSGFDKLHQYYRDPQENTPLCVQVLKWAQEGKLILN
jgi:hypothetical protein